MVTFGLELGEALFLRSIVSRLNHFENASRQRQPASEEQVDRDDSYYNRYEDSNLRKTNGMK